MLELTIENMDPENFRELVGSFTETPPLGNSVTSSHYEDEIRTGRVVFNEIAVSSPVGTDFSSLNSLAFTARGLINNNKWEIQRIQQSPKLR